MLKSFTGTAVGLLVCASAFAQTADDCIGQYETLKAQFEQASAANGLAEPPVPYCVESGNLVSLDAEGPLPPISCEGGGWDHWHLEAKAVLGNEAICVLMLRGLDGREGCGTGEIRMALPANEAVRWRNYLREACSESE